MNRREILQAMEANFEYHMLYFVDHVPGFKKLLLPGIKGVSASINDETFNYVFQARFENGSVSERIEQVIELFGEIPFTWLIGERDSPPDLGKSLCEEGLELKEENPGMALFVNATYEKPSLRIERAVSNKELENFSLIYASIGEYPHLYDQFYKFIPLDRIREKAPYEIYVGYEGKKGVTAGILVFHAGVAGIYYIMTIPGYQKRGYATQMMHRLLHRAQEKRVRVAVLQASPEGSGLYKHLGFEQITTYWQYGF